MEVQLRKGYPYKLDDMKKLMEAMKEIYGRDAEDEDYLIVFDTNNSPGSISMTIKHKDCY